MVLGLVRGGLPVAYEVATALDAPLDLTVVRKLGAPFQPELDIGALVDGGQPPPLVSCEAFFLSPPPLVLGKGSEGAGDKFTDSRYHARLRDIVGRLV